MLIELRIENLLLIERAELALDQGLNVITGETGAGKTMLAHAIDLLLGGRSRRGIVRPGAEEAYVEGLFSLPEGLLERPEFAAITQRLPDPQTREVALARRVTPDGRTRAYIGGRAATAAELRALGGDLVSFYGQHEHRKLTLAGAQLEALDGFCGDGHRGRVAEAAELHDRARALDHQLAELELADGRRERELGLIEFELAEIEAVEPTAEEEAELRAEHDRLRGVDALRAAAEGSLGMLTDDESGGATALAAAAIAGLGRVADADRALDRLTERIEAIVLELQDAAGELRAYSESLAADPERLAWVEDRLDVYERLKRKHGGSVAAVLAHAERCREDCGRLAGAADRIESGRAEFGAVRERQRAVADKISKTRRTAAPKLAAAVRERLADLALADASFDVEIETDSDNPRRTGADTVEFLIAPNPGIAASPLRETASGGELSRVMLALLTASGARDDQTFVFDEIDAGIGGHTARAVGEQLRILGATRQVICITHLPQVAAAAERHFQIEKSSNSGDARTEVSLLTDRAIVDELCRMMGADGDDSGARRHARELLAAA
ncbi:MAG: DNA repair protein RecN [Solirubrobacterales bacterium]